MGMIFDFDWQTNKVIESCNWEILPEFDQYWVLMTPKPSFMLLFCHGWTFIGINQRSINRHQMVQNVAGVFPDKEERSHYSKLMSLHWLPICLRVNFNILITYLLLKSFKVWPQNIRTAVCVPTGSQPGFFIQDPYHILNVPNSHLKTKGYQAFAVKATSALQRSAWGTSLFSFQIF